MTEDEKRKIATFRFTVIGEIVASRLDPGEQERIIRDKCARKWQIPFSNRTRISRSTILRWIRCYKQGGDTLESLYPDDRNDRGKSRRIDAETSCNLIRIREEMPMAPVRKLIETMNERHLVSPGCRLSKTTVYRFLNERKLMKQAAHPIDRRKFEAELPNDLWQSDVMHGPHVMHEGRLKKTYLIAFLDDHSRLIPYAAFYFSEAVPWYLDALERAITTRGLPRKLYVDNGSAFRSHHLETVTASLGIALLHARPYTPEGKGKIERFFRSVRSMFLADAPPIDSIEALNQAFGQWLQGTYHERRHSATGQSPFERFTANLHCIRSAPANVKDHFRKMARRRVANDRTITLEGNLYEAPVELIGKQIELLYHPHDLQRVEARYQQKSYGLLHRVNTALNCRIKRDRNSQLELHSSCETGELL